MEGHSNLTAELAALTDHVEQSTARLRVLRDRAPELDGVAVAVEDRLTQRTAELARAQAEAETNAERIRVLRGQLGAFEDRMRSFRRRMAEFANLLGRD
jgi:hypothetical protein